MLTVDRDTQRPNIIYVHPLTNEAFVSPDGVGRFYYDSVHQAYDEHGDLPVQLRAWSAD